MQFVETYENLQHEMQQYKNRMDSLLKNWFTIFAKSLNYYQPTTVKNLNKLTDANKKKMVLGISFEYNPRATYDAEEFIKFNYYKETTDSIKFIVKGYDGFGYIADNKKENELIKLYQHLLTEEVWRYAVKRKETKFGYEDFVSSFKLEDLNKSFNQYSDSLNKHFYIFTVKLPKYISDSYTIAFHKENFKKSVHRDVFYSSYL